MDELWNPIIEGYTYQLRLQPWFDTILGLIAAIRARPDAADFRPDKAQSRLYLHLLGSNDLFIVIAPLLREPDHYHIVDLITFQDASIDGNDLIPTVMTMLDDVQAYVARWRRF